MEKAMTHPPIREAVYYVLRYYDVFRYPLLAEEVYGNTSVSCTLAEVQHALDELVTNGSIFTARGFYGIRHNLQELVADREQANILAYDKIRQAIHTGKLIHRFPFVRFVGISGSLSKGYATKESDFDFFIITEPDRLWICRTLLHIFKKFTFLFGQQQKFCMNYFVDATHLELEEKNIYTSIELSSLIPVAGAGYYAQLLSSNHWIAQTLPNGYRKFYDTQATPDQSSAFKRLAERILSIQGNTWNKRLMRFTDFLWKRKWKRRGYPMEDYDLALKTTLHHSKNHPANYQKKVLTHLECTPQNELSIL